MTAKAVAFVKANAKSPVVYGSVITKGQCSARRDDPPEPTGCYYRLADGQVFKLTSAECRLVGNPRWAFAEAEAEAA